MSRREDLRREIEAVLDELTDESGTGVSRAPEPEPVVEPVVEEADAHGHAHMVTFPMWADDEEGNLVEIDPGRFGRYDPEVDEVRPEPQEPGGEHVTEPHGGGHEPPSGGARPPKRTRRKASGSGR